MKYERSSRYQRITGNVEGYDEKVYNEIGINHNPRSGEEVNLEK